MHTISRVFAFLIMLSLFSVSSCRQAAPTATSAPTLQPGDTERKLLVNDLERSYILHIPPGLDMAHPAPLVFAFHGSGEQPAEMELLTGFGEIADKAGFLLVYPVGIGQTWNAGTCCGYALQNNIDDESFIRQILSDLGMVVSVDSKRIYATGFSNGAGMVYRLACDMSDIFAAVAPVAGSLLYDPCQPSQPVSLIDVHGLSDTTSPYEGGGQFSLPPMEELIKTWAQLNGCTDSPQVEKKEKIFTQTAYASCKAGTAVEHYAMEGGGHAWPSKYLWDASQAIWDFFAAHPKQ